MAFGILLLRVVLGMTMGAHCSASSCRSPPVGRRHEGRAAAERDPGLRTA